MHTAATVKIDPERRLSHHSLPDPSTDGSSPAKLRRRASQGSFRTKPSPVSRFLSKGSAAIHFPSWEHRSSTPSRNRSADSRLRLSTSVSRGPRPLTGHSHSSSPWNSPSSFPADYPSTLPPTPPEDDSHIAWNVQSEMLLFDQQPHRKPGSSAMMDDGPGVDTSPTTGPSDTLSSPSDGLSHGSSSSGGSPGPHDEMDCQQDVGSWLDHGINVTGTRYPSAGLLRLLLTRSQYHRWGFRIHEVTPSKSFHRHSRTRERPISRYRCLKTIASSAPSSRPCTTTSSPASRLTSTSLTRCPNNSASPTSLTLRPTLPAPRPPRTTISMRPSFPVLQS